MDKELINRAWRILPAEFKRVVKAHYVGLNAAYKAYLSKDSLTNEECDRCNAMREKIVLYNMYFGRHNLTSDAEGEEEMLIVPRKKVQEQYALNVNALREGNLTDMQIEIATKVKDTLYYLFGSKCLPDEVNDVASNVASSKPKPTEPKFKVGDTASYVCSPTLKHKCTVTKVMQNEHSGKWEYNVMFEWGEPGMWISESDLEPYTEPDTSHETPVCENHSGNTSQKEVNVNSNCNLLKDCDKQLDNILKDSFSKERKLNIAAMAMRGILSNPQLLKITIETYQEEIGSPDIFVAVAKAAKAQADALIAESEKGGEE